MKKILIGGLMFISIICAGLLATNSYANEEWVDIFMDCGKGSCKTSDGYDTINAENRGKVGAKVSSVWNFIEEPTSIDQDFLGWHICYKSTGKQVEGTGLLTTEEVNNYIIPNYVINIVAQWTGREGYPINNNAYAVFWNGEGEPCYDVKVSIINNGICYSGYGFVSIPESIYSTWTGTVTYRIEPTNGVYTMYDGSWTNEAYEYDGTAREFKMEKYRNCYISASKTGKGRDVTSSRTKVNDWYYRAAFVQPEVSVINKAPAKDVIGDSTIVPDSYTVETQVHQSGASFDAAVEASKKDHGTENVVVVDINVKDEQGTKVTELSDYVDVKVPIPSTYTIKEGNTVIVYYLNDNGELEECETVYHDEDPDNRYVTFKTNHFSVYVLVEVENEPETEPETEAETEGQTEIITKPEETKPESNEGSENETVKTDKETGAETKNENKETQSLQTNDNSNGLLVWVLGAVIAVALVVGIVLVIKNKK